MSTGFLLVDQPNPYTAQGVYPRRGVRGKLTGTVILHTSEGAWQAGVDSLTNLVRTRSDYGCYHRACDWVDIARYYPWEWETWQDSETNNWAVGIAAACRTTDWAIMPADVREGFYRNMALMAADFVKYMKATYNITVPLRRISGEQARAGVPGFCAHGDSGIARTDPGVQFDWALFFKYTSQALGTTPTSKGLFVTLTAAQEKLILDRVTAYLDAPVSAVDEKSATAVWATQVKRTSGNVSALQELADAKTGTIALQGKVAGLVAALEQIAKAPGASVDLEAVTAAAEAGAQKALSDLTVTIKQGA